MLNEQDFDKFFNGFTGGQGSSIRELYNIMPSMSGNQMAIYQQIQALALKWQLDDVQQFLKEFIHLAKANRSLGFAPRFSQFLKSVTLDEYIRGFKLSSARNENQ